MKRKTSSALTITMNASISMIVTAMLLLVGVFVLDELGIGITSSPKYWVEKVLRSIATFLIMLSTSNVCEEARKKLDKDYNDRLDGLSLQYNRLMENGYTEDLECYIEQINRCSKYQAYVSKLKRKLNRTRNEKARQRIEKKLLLTPEEVWDNEIRVKYTKVTISRMLSGDYDISENESEYNIVVAKGKFALKKLGMKLIMLVAYGWFAIDFGYSFVGFTKEMIVPMIIKVVIVLIAACSGVSFGFEMINNRKTVLKNKLRIFSQFWQRVDDKNVDADKRYVVPIPKDVVVEKIKTKYNALPL